MKVERYDMPYRFFNDPSGNSIRNENGELLNQLLRRGVWGREQIEKIYCKAFPGKSRPNTSEKMSDVIMAHAQSQSPELRAELRSIMLSVTPDEQL
jgi:uncharacterized protein (DUF2132 family)